MRKRLTCLFLTLILLLPIFPSALATDVSNLKDVNGHWAQAQITWALVQGYFQGISDTTFSPDSTMSRGMFVTVLGRIAEIDPEDYNDWYLGDLFADVPENSYYAPYINWAVRCGITNGTSNWNFSPNDPVTRQQMALFLQRYVSTYGYRLTALSSSNENFLDAEEIASYAADAVDEMRLSGILTGRSVDGGYAFCPNDGATRAECAVVLERLSRSLRSNGKVMVNPVSVSVSAENDTLTLGQSMMLSASVSPSTATNQHIVWVSEDPSVAIVDLNGRVTAQRAGIVKIYAYTWNGKYKSYTITCQTPPKASSLASANDSYEEKCQLIFGETVSDPRRYYQSSDEAASHMVNIPIKVWDFSDSTRTTKVTKTLYLTVHENIAETVQAIFDEIYHGDEQFPIKDAGCYRYEPGSEHMPGLAIDLNSNENYECTNEGVATAGSYWKPGEDPYSIPRGGDVETAFKRYGFGWGADWNSKKDYMHFSFFGY